MDDDDYFLMELEHLNSHEKTHEEFIISLLSKLQNISSVFTLIMVSNLTSLQKIERILDLLDHGADINSDTFSLSPLAIAIESQDEILINFLITKGADVNLPSKDSSYPLQMAASSPYLVRLLLSKGADPDLSYALYSAIDIAADDDDEFDAAMGLESFNILLEAGANPDFPNKDGATALMEACKHRLYELLPILIEYCDVDLQNTYTGETALHIAIDQKISKEAIVSLLEKNPNLEIEDNKNQTALLKAIVGEYIPVVELLLRAGADPWCIDGDDHSYLHYAMESRSRPIIEAVLIRRQLDIEEGKVSANQEIVSEEDIKFASSIFKSIVPLLLRYR